MKNLTSTVDALCEMIETHKANGLPINEHFAATATATAQLSQIAAAQSGVFFAPTNVTQENDMNCAIGHGQKEETAVAAAVVNVVLTCDLNDKRYDPSELLSQVLEVLKMSSTC